MKNPKEAKELFISGYNCAQSMLYTYGKTFFKEESSALKLASAFGAGISYRGELCGAVSSSLMVIGLHFGASELHDDISKEVMYKVVKEFTEAFEDKNGSLICNRLLKCEINTEEGLEYARQNGVFDKTCPLLIESASDILASLLKKYS